MSYIIEKKGFLLFFPENHRKKEKNAREITQYVIEY